MPAVYDPIQYISLDPVTQYNLHPPPQILCQGVIHIYILLYPKYKHLFLPHHQHLRLLCCVRRIVFW